VLGTTTSGAENDLKQATDLARKMTLDWGMSERFEHMALGDRREHVFLGEELARGRQYSETTAREIDEEVRNILDESYKKALDTLQGHREGLDRLAEVLIEREEVQGKEVMELIGLEKHEEEQPPENKDARASA
jgi:cell division protease FtsH